MIVGIDVEVRSESWVAGASGLPVVLSRFELLCFLGLIKCVFLGLVLVGFSIWCWVFLGGSDYNGGFLGGVLVFFLDILAVLLYF